MDCSILSPLAIETINFLLSFLHWIPALFVFISVTADLNNITELKFPGYDNSHIRTAHAAIHILIGFTAFFIVWGAGLLLTENFRCIFT